MAGTKKTTRPLKVTKSTPTQRQDGVPTNVKYAALGKYTVNVRSFHPNRQFEPLGFRFHGDDRAFSLGESWFDQDKQDDNVTSRIWQRYMLDMNLQESADLTKAPATRLRTESNMSKPGPDLWRFLGGEESYFSENLKPRGTLKAKTVDTPHGAQKVVRLLSHYGGENHAFATSEFQQKYLKTTIVPTLDVFSELFVRVERISLYMDIVSLTYGDGFPNCESFIKDAAGNKLFLGTHVRIGYPATHLWGEQQRLMWANAIRIEIDKDGNFGEKLWIFGQVVGGPPNLRNKYPTTGGDQVCSISAKTPAVVSGKFLWNCGDPGEIIEPKGNSALPLHLSAFGSLELVRGLMDATWKVGPRKEITRTQWNDFHLHSNPNEGRPVDDYDVADEKWKPKTL
jgi:hypothetical protein